MKRRLADLKQRLERATGPDPAIDRAIADALAGRIGDDAGANPGRRYTGSVDDCLALVAQALPGWHWHVGHGPDGVLPYAALSRTPPGATGNADETRVESSAPTVPLALLRAAMKALERD